MLQIIRYSFLILFISILVTFACTNSKSDTQKPTESEILLFFLKQNHTISQSNNHVILICGPLCKGCVYNMLLKLDPVFCDTKNIDNWHIITSHDFVKDIPLSCINISLEKTWENANLDFYNITYYSINNNSITKKITLTADNPELFYKKICHILNNNNANK